METYNEHITARLIDDAILWAERKYTGDPGVTESMLWNAAASEFGRLLMRKIMFSDPQGIANIGRAMNDCRQVLDGRWDRDR